MNASVTVQAKALKQKIDRKYLVDPCWEIKGDSAGNLCYRHLKTGANFMMMPEGAIYASVAADINGLDLDRLLDSAELIHYELEESDGVAFDFGANRKLGDLFAADRRGEYVIGGNAAVTRYDAQGAVLGRFEGRATMVDIEAGLCAMLVEEENGGQLVQRAHIDNYKLDVPADPVWMRFDVLGDNLLLGYDDCLRVYNVAKRRIEVKMGAARLAAQMGGTLAVYDGKMLHIRPKNGIAARVPIEDVLDLAVSLDGHTVFARTTHNIAVADWNHVHTRLPLFNMSSMVVLTDVIYAAAENKIYSFYKHDEVWVQSNFHIVAAPTGTNIRKIAANRQILYVLLDNGRLVRATRRGIAAANGIRSNRIEPLQNRQYDLGAPSRPWDVVLGDTTPAEIENVEPCDLGLNYLRNSTLAEFRSDNYWRSYELYAILTRALQEILEKKDAMNTEDVAEQVSAANE
jgi:hypothetical protein